jgi:hypothetical protein
VTAIYNDSLVDTDPLYTDSGSSIGVIISALYIVLQNADNTINRKQTFFKQIFIRLKRDTAHRFWEPS